MTRTAIFQHSFHAIYTFLFYFILFYFFVGEGREMHDARAPCVGLQYGLPLGSFARWTICRLTYPLKPFPAGCLGYIPLIEIHGWVWVCVEVDESFVSPEGSEFALAN